MFIGCIGNGGRRWLLAMAFAAAGAASWAEEGAAAKRDALVFKDGDRVHGVLVSRDKEVIVFQADRFGELRVPVADAVVINAVKSAAPKPAGAAAAVPPPAPAPAAPVGQQELAAAAEKAEEERVSIWELFSPSVLTARVRNFFGPWHGRLAVSSEIVADVTDRNGLAIEANLRRKWSNDEVQLTARYDFAQTNDVPTMDLLKGAGLWRHDFNKWRFAQFRPTVEWNRASKRRGVPIDYVLVQQEFGFGFVLLNKPARKLRVGASENLFDLWTTAPGSDHTSRAVESMFEEIELTLPWRMGLLQRGVWYPVPGKVDGWEHRIELNKKLTETLSTSLRHEVRRNNPDGSAQDYTRMKLLLGLDF